MQSDPHHDETVPTPGEPVQSGPPPDSATGQPLPSDSGSVQPPVDPPPPVMPGPPGQQAPPSDLRFTSDGTTPTEPMPAPSLATSGDPSMPEPTSLGPPSAPQTAAALPAPTATVIDQAIDPSSAPGDPPAAASAGSPPADWLDQVCPYLLSEDGTWRSTQPDPGHRCMAQDPPGELPPMFQERFCLSDRHVRCEWFKSAQTVPAGRTPSASSGGEGVELRPVAGATTASSGGGPSRPSRTVLIGAGLIGGFLILVIIAVIFGTGDGSDGSAASPGATQASGSDATPRPTAAPEVTSAPTVTPELTPAPPSVILIEYEIQADERLVRIGDKFGIRRGAIIRANEGMDVDSPGVKEGQVILVPVPGEMTSDEIRAVPGFVAFVDGDGG